MCVSHTYPTHDAGRVRRVTCGTRVRLLGERTVSQLESISHRLALAGPDKDWTLFLMGYFCAVDKGCINRLAVYHRLCMLSGLSSFSLHISVSIRTCANSIAPGVLCKLTSSSVWADSVEAYRSDRVERSAVPRIGTQGTDMLRSCASAYFTLHGFIASDRPLRSSLSSA